MTKRVSWPAATAIGLIVLGACAAPQTAERELPTINLKGDGAFPLDQHLESADLVAGEMTNEAIFEAGGDLFHAVYLGPDGVGVARLPDGSPSIRFQATPPGHGALAQINSQSCGGCHLRSTSGPAHSHLIGDPGNDGEPPFNVRSTTSLLGNGLVQRLAEEMTDELLAARDALAEEAAASPGERVERALSAKGLDFGTLAATADAEGDVTWDRSGVTGVTPDLMVRPLGWKGHVPTIRLNTLAAANFVMGMQGEEFVWRLPPEAGPDPDGDGVERELSVGDITAIAIYNAGQETPQSLTRLAELGLVAAPSDADEAKIARGREAFESAGCASCHVPELRLNDAVFEEPTARGGGLFYDRFLAERDPTYDPANPVRFDLLTEADEPRVEPHPEGGAIVRLYGDLRKHHMGRQLADSGGPTAALVPMLAPAMVDDEIVLIAPTAFLTPELWGVGNTGPWLHDGRAGSLEEAVVLHGEDDPPPPGDAGRSEAQESRDAFLALEEADREALLVFLRSLRTFIPPPAPAPTAS